MSLSVALGLILGSLVLGLLVGGMVMGWRQRQQASSTLSAAPVIGREVGQASAVSEPPGGQEVASPQLMARLQDLTQRYERQIEVMRKAYEVEKASAEEELRLIREKLERIVSAGEKGRHISSTAFVPTQFDETAPPTPPAPTGFAATQFEERKPPKR